ncbi:divalent-cation tolerance protein CutA [Comamonas sp. Y33R10-2]|uniref:divalent-cation tolerance protein CutA n=1 Tax=Comamonas sp. Y33R10-2 TaxID=2853257 RepID=UPI001C5CB662|nr:divalent cation tolerance protein CutA [Comamonas sp. Y33R10-2]QXZ09523.1 divalent-cation tolerance protein CutA [Comamonas sp. Y33R10-2]
MSTLTSPTASLLGSHSDSHTSSQWVTLCVVSTTMGDAAEAEDMARALVAAKAAACVQTERITSYYEWDGVLQSSPEWRLLCKTLPEVLPRLTQLMRDKHSYKVPQITMRTELCLSDYGQWLKLQVKG